VGGPNRIIPSQCIPPSFDCHANGLIAPSRKSQKKSSAGSTALPAKRSSVAPRKRRGVFGLRRALRFLCDDAAPAALPSGRGSLAELSMLREVAWSFSTPPRPTWSSARRRAAARASLSTACSVIELINERPGARARRNVSQARHVWSADADVMLSCFRRPRLRPFTLPLRAAVLTTDCSFFARKSPRPTPKPRKFPVDAPPLLPSPRASGVCSPPMTPARCQVQARLVNALIQLRACACTETTSEGEEQPNRRARRTLPCIPWVRARDHGTRHFC
jgi:hypothetical protein